MVSRVLLLVVVREGCGVLEQHSAVEELLLVGVEVELFLQVTEGHLLVLELLADLRLVHAVLLELVAVGEHLVEQVGHVVVVRLVGDLVVDGRSRRVARRTRAVGDHLDVLVDGVAVAVLLAVQLDLRAGRGQGRWVVGAEVGGGVGGFVMKDILTPIYSFINHYLFFFSIHYLLIFYLFIIHLFIYCYNNYLY